MNNTPENQNVNVEAQPVEAQATQQECPQQPIQQACEANAAQPVYAQQPVNPNAAQPVYTQQPVYAQQPIQPIMNQQPVYTQQPVYAQQPTQQAYAPVYGQQPADSGKKSVWSRFKLLFILGGVALVILIIFVSLFGTYASANSDYDAGNYASAAVKYNSLGGFLGGSEKGAECAYLYAGEEFDNENYLMAYTAYLALGEYKDSANKAQLSYYNFGLQCQDNEEYEQAIEVFTELGDYSDSPVQIDLTNLYIGVSAYHAGELDSAYELIDAIESSDSYVNEIRDLYLNIILARYYEDANLLDYDVLLQLFNAISPYAADYKDAYDVCDSKVFYYVKFFGCKWTNGKRYTIKAKINFKSDNYSLGVTYDVEWPSPSGSSWDLNLNNRGLCFTVNGSEWFTVVGFSDADKLHPSQVYILGSDGQTYNYDFHSLN